MAANPSLFHESPINGIARIHFQPDARSKAQPKSLTTRVSNNGGSSFADPERAAASMQGSALAGDIYFRQLFLRCHSSPDDFICRTWHYSAAKGSEEPGVAKSGKRSATRRFSTLNDFLSTSAKVTRPKKSSRICTRCPADKVRTTIPEKPMNTPSAILTSDPGITPSSTTIGSSDSKHSFSSRIAPSGTAGILCPKCTKLLMPVICLIWSEKFSSMQRIKT
jgi:hypothetical protein